MDRRSAIRSLAGLVALAVVSPTKLIALSVDDRATLLAAARTGVIRDQVFHLTSPVSFSFQDTLTIERCVFVFAGLPTKGQAWMDFSGCRDVAMSHCHITAPYSTANPHEIGAAALRIPGDDRWLYQ